MIRIFNNNCLDVMKELKNESVDLIVTDPPYKTTVRGNKGGTGGLFANKEMLQGRVFRFNDIEPSDYLPEFYRLLKDGSHCYVMSNHVNLQKILNEGTKAGFNFIKCLIWDKGNKITGQWYMSQFEYIIFFRKGKGVRINNCGTSDILNVPNKKTKDSEGKNLHDTEKPVSLMKILVENSSKEGEFVLDPFMGIGGTAIACLETKREFLGVEIDDKYYTIANRRIRIAEEGQDNTLF